MPNILLLTNNSGTPDQVLPALELLDHPVRLLPAEPGALFHAGPGVTGRPHDGQAADLALLDARSELAAARSLAGLLKSTFPTIPLILVLTEGGMTAVGAGWGADDVVLATAGPAELEARIRLATRPAETTAEPVTVIRAAGVLIDEASYTARIDGEPMNLTYKEFELLKYLAQYPGRVFTRDQLLSEVWGYDYYGGTRTVDVHIRRLRAKLGADHEGLIGTVRNVGYRFTT